MEELSPRIRERIAALQPLGGSLLRAGHDALSAAAGKLYTSHFYVIGAVKKAVSLHAGFLRELEAQNFTCAAALLRIHLDTAIRLSALWQVENQDAFASAVLGGERIDRMKDRGGARMTDRHLVRSLGEYFKWIEPVYEATSGFVHFSERHIFASVIATNAEERHVQFFVTDVDSHVPEEKYLEALDAFRAVTHLILELLRGWTTAHLESEKRQRSPER